MNKNRFIPGFVAGFATTLLLSGAAFSIYLVKTDGISLVQTGSEVVQSEEAADSTETTADTSDSLTSKNSAILSKLTTLESIIGEYYLNDVDADTLADGVYKGLLESLDDPYSCYYTADEYTALKESTSGIYCGIGATVSQNVTTGIITIVKPFATGPAYAAGLLPGDVLYKVDGEEVTGEDLSEVVSKMKGEEGTTVTISVVREGSDDPLEFEITRQQIEIPTIEYEMLDNNIGYIAVSEFDEVTADQYKDALDDLEDQGMEALVVDLRNNPGGRLDTVCDMLDRMLPEGLIVYQEDKDGNRTEEKSTGDEEFTQPLAVLINGNSASASEIFAGAIQDYGIGTLVGTTSFGKGIVQSIIPLNDGTAVKVTVSKYYTPNGRNIHGTGIDPDITVELDESVQQQVEIDHADDNQLQTAIETLEDQMSESK